mmetsp:Transcript_42640/g.87170  ORF Transcript_42640/g.87170 Transcript_42640/m.87170 type:complete len:93 (-) Transcript_42640:643-921(-)
MPVHKSPVMHCSYCFDQRVDARVAVFRRPSRHADSLLELHPIHVLEEASDFYTRNCNDTAGAANVRQLHDMAEVRAQLQVPRFLEQGIQRLE